MSKMEAYKAELARFLEGFGANVRHVRTAKSPHCSQERLSYTTRLHRTEIGKIEQGAVEPRLTTLLLPRARAAAACAMQHDDHRHLRFAVARSAQRQHGEANE